MPWNKRSPEFAIIRANENIISVESVMNSGRGRAWLRAAKAMIAATTRKPTSARCEITRIPTRPDQGHKTIEHQDREDAAPVREQHQGQRAPATTCQRRAPPSPARWRWHRESCRRAAPHGDRMADSGPMTNWPAPKPIRNAVRTICRRLGASTWKVEPMFG